LAKYINSGRANENILITDPSALAGMRIESKQSKTWPVNADAPLQMIMKLMYAMYDQLRGEQRCDISQWNMHGCKSHVEIPCAQYHHWIATGIGGNHLCLTRIWPTDTLQSVLAYGQRHNAIGGSGACAVERTFE
jgi:hypothetical protein